MFTFKSNDKWHTTVNTWQGETAVNVNTSIVEDYDKNTMILHEIAVENHDPVFMALNFPVIVDKVYSIKDNAGETLLSAMYDGTEWICDGSVGNDLIQVVGYSVVLHI